MHRQCGTRSIFGNRAGKRCGVDGIVLVLKDFISVFCRSASHQPRPERYESRGERHRKFLLQSHRQPRTRYHVAKKWQAYQRQSTEVRCLVRFVCVRLPCLHPHRSYSPFSLFLFAPFLSLVCWLPTRCHCSSPAPITKPVRPRLLSVSPCELCELCRRCILCVPQR